MARDEIQEKDETGAKVQQAMKQIVGIQEGAWIVMDWKSRGFGGTTYGDMRQERIEIYCPEEIARSRTGYNPVNHPRDMALTNILVKMVRRGILLGTIKEQEMDPGAMLALLPEYISGYVHWPQYYFGTEGIYEKRYEGWCHTLEYQPACDLLPGRFKYAFTGIAPDDRTLRTFLMQNKARKGYEDLGDPGCPLGIDELVLQNCYAGPTNSTYGAIMRDVVKARCG